MLFSFSVQNAFRGTHAVIMVFDMGDLRSLVSVKDYKMNLKRISRRFCNVPVLLVGNKVYNLFI